VPRLFQFRFAHTQIEVCEMKKLGHFITALVLICLIAMPVHAAQKGNRKIQSFTKAKRILMREIYRGHQQTFYCGSQYTQGKYVIRISFISIHSATNFLNGAMGTHDAWIAGAGLLKD
jgi:hypothetical protein